MTPQGSRSTSDSICRIFDRRYRQFGMPNHARMIAAPRSCYHLDMKRKIVGYHIDAECHWVAELECGHGQHVRDDPPWKERPWVRTEQGRASRLGQELNCVRCDEFARKVAEAVIKECRASLVAAYEDAGTSGLCADGRWEMALDSLRSINVSRIIS
jgi:hypothetical protein